MTPREKEVFQLLLQGKSNKQIALALDISEFTARDHVCSILRKKGVKSRGELLAAVMSRYVL
ncbi:LuxR C-terminal-related transcriptional regulator [Pseudomonas sp. MYb185]|uniref:LuxR C-terminal-related transcriptional regulator n=1 Tax=Pseudomonas sp. MYb185 TaxID=1848729 RepID=UPI0013048E92|nr:LuxR C-terminal-related transcriptional regulator [Pseudomonas sp. MYb185]